MGLKNRRPSSKNPPTFSHEFVIQNHADIVSCVVMLFVVGLLFQGMAPLASMFVAVSHNVTSEVRPDVMMYTYGAKDAACIFFYFLICIVFHAIIQEYIFDKLNRRMHLSKTKHSKFNESCQLLSFYLVTVIWGGDILFKEGLLTNIPKLWEVYPHSEMTFTFKFFFIIQLSYWLHCYPELYFQKVKKEEMWSRIQYSTLYLVFLSSAYILNFTRVSLYLLVLHCIVEAIFHIVRLLYFADMSGVAYTGFMVWNLVFVLVRLGSVTLSVLTFWYGLALTEGSAVDIPSGNFNTQLIRLNCLAGICLLQAWMMWKFITFHLKSMREKAANQQLLLKKKQQEKKLLKKGKKEEKVGSEDDVSELPEVDQNTKKSLRSRHPVKSK